MCVCVCFSKIVFTDLFHRLLQQSNLILWLISSQSSFFAAADSVNKSEAIRLPDQFLTSELDKRQNFLSHTRISRRLAFFAWLVFRPAAESKAVLRKLAQG